MKLNTGEGYVHLDIIWMKTNFLKLTLKSLLQMPIKKCRLFLQS